MLKLLRVLLCALLLVIGSASVAAATHGQPDLMVPIKGAGVGQDERDLDSMGCTLEEGQAPLIWRFTSEGTGREDLLRSGFCFSRSGRRHWVVGSCHRADAGI